MLLIYNPYDIFASSTTPVGLYARNKWLKQGLLAQWEIDYQRRVEIVLSHQSPDGSWRGLAVETIRHLFDLHLTIRKATRQIDIALEWLTDLAMDARQGRSAGGEPLSEERLRSLPFVPGNFDTLLTSAVLFLSSIFGHDQDVRVLAMYENLSNAIIAGEPRLQDLKSISNVLRAFVVHPIYSIKPATKRIVTDLAAIQENLGQWPDDINLYQTVNALAHLDLEKANIQVKKAFGHLVQTQNNDGTWGDTDREWNTFLVVHAMRNKRML